jgi:hypothetical protein
VFGVLVLTALLFAFTPSPANAQFGGVVSVVKDIPRLISENVSKLRTVIAKRLNDAAALAFKNGLNSYLSKLTQENLISIATSNPGQKPLFITNPGKFFAEVGTGTARDYLDLATAGVPGREIPPSSRETRVSVQRIVRSVIEGDLPASQCRAQCEEKSELLLTGIEQAQSDLGRDQAFAQKDPFQTVDCSSYVPGATSLVVTQCVTAERDFIRTVQSQADADIKACLKQNCAKPDPGAILDSKTPEVQGKPNTDALKALNKYFGAVGSPVGQLAAVYTASISKGTSAEQAARDLPKTAVGPLLSTIAGEIRVPSTGTAALLQQAILKSTTASEIRTGSVLADAFDIFAKTLIARLRQNLLSGPCGLNLSLCKGPQTSSQIGNLLFGSGQVTGIAGAKLQFATLGKVDYRTGDPAKTPIQPADLLQSQGLIDTQFREAVEEKLTVKEALEKGLLDGGRTFGFDQNGKEPQDGYPYRSLVYLRKYRIVPVGWELAALYNKNVSDSPKNLSLTDLVNAFDQCGQGTCSNSSNLSCTTGAQQSVTDQECGPGNTCVQKPVSPYCGLVDPNWVLKAPATFCRRIGAGEEVVSRQFVCDDTNGDGKINCDTAGQDVGHWEIQRKTDSCSDEQSCIAENDDGSCRAYGYCVAERASFRFDGTSCPNVDATCTTYTGSDGESRSLLASTLDSRDCSAETAGCQWYCAEPSRDPDGTWTCTETAGTKQNFTGAAQACPSNAVGCRQFLRTTGGANLLPGGSSEFYTGTANDATPDNFDPDGTGRGWLATGATTLAVTGDTPSGSTTAVQLSGSGQIESTVDTGSPTGDRTFAFSYSGRAETGTCSGGFTVGATGATADYTTTWTRFSVADAVASGVALTTVRATVAAVSGCTLLLDDFKLEEGVTATAYRDYGRDAVHLGAGRTQCPVEAVGCEKYTPTAGGAAVPGIVRTADTCPAQFVGCRSFTEEAVTNNGADATLPERQERTLSLVPSTGRSCSAADVGCEEYTNLDTVAQGGEGREYYRFVRQCVKPTASNTDTFYTWTGSDQVGYHLEAYTLKVTNAGVGGPCTSLSLSAVGNADPACNDPGTPVGDCTGQVGTNPDCRDYFDQSLNHYARLESKVIAVSNDCHPYRNTLDEASGRSQIYNILPSSSISCASSAAQCRAYAGSAGANTTAILTDNFEDKDTQGWTGGVISNTAVSVGGHSMLVAPAVFHDVATVLTDGGSYTLTFWAASASNADSTVTALLSDTGVGGQPFPGAAVAKSYIAGSPPTYRWNQYTLGPVRFTGSTVGQRLYIQGTQSFLIDNIVLTAVVDNVYQIRDSYTRCEGNENCAAYRNRANQTVTVKQFSSLCQEQFIGCEAMYDTQNSTSPYSENVFVRGRDTGVRVSADAPITLVNDPRKACKAQDKGCSAFGRPALDENGRVSGFSTVTLKNDPDQYSSILCTQTELFCDAFTTSSGSAFFKDPGRRVCEYVQPAGLSLGWYLIGTTTPCSTVTSGGTTYVSSDLDRCEERPLDLNGDGINDFCYRSSPDTTCIPCVARLCPDEFNGCTEYLDPSDPPKCQAACAYQEQNGVPVKMDAKCRVSTAASALVGCRGYYQLKSTVKASDCNGQLDPKSGCRAFNDTSGGSLNLRSAP